MSLSAEQWKFIAARLLAGTDKDAALNAGIPPQTVANWKQTCPDFVTEYEASFTDGVEVAKKYTRKMLGKAAQTLSDGLEAQSVNKDGELAPDWRARMKAVELTFKTHGLLREKVDWTPDLSSLTDEELLNLDRILGRVAKPQ